MKMMLNIVFINDDEDYVQAELTQVNQFDLALYKEL